MDILVQGSDDQNCFRKRVVIKKIRLGAVRDPTYGSQLGGQCNCSSEE